MSTRKSLIRRLIPWIVAAAVLAALVFFVFVPIYSQKDTVDENPPEISYLEEGGTPLSPLPR